MADVFALFCVVRTDGYSKYTAECQTEGRRAMGTRPLHQIGINKYN